MPDHTKQFVLPYEAEYTAHRTDAGIRRVMELHLKARELVPGPPLAPELIELEGSDEVHDKPQACPSR